jgi:PIN domain nuclease of toxin-antitoxin system
MSNRIVLDTSAYLALAHRENGHMVVAERLETADAIMCAVNVAEALSKQADIGVPAEEALELFRLTGIAIHPFGEEEALQCSLLRKVARPYGLSLGDRACLALGRTLGCPVLTADRIWRELDIDVPIDLIR